MPHSRVNTILQDYQGYIWIGSPTGVSKFDGKVFQNFAQKDGLGDNRVSCLFELSNKTLLIGHDNGTISIYDGKHFRSYLLGDGIKRIFCVVRDKENQIWIGTQGGGAFQIDEKKFEKNVKEKKFKNWNHSKGLSKDVTGILPDKNGNIRMVTDLGLKVKSKKDEEFQFFLPKGIGFVQFTAMA